MHPLSNRGLTSIELITVVAIISILFSMAGPSFNHSIHKHQANKNIHQLLRLLALARTKAVTIQQNVTLCGVSDGASCKSQWNGGDNMIVFIDGNHNRIYDKDERLLASLALTGNGSILWKGSGKRPYFRYNSSGYANEFGSFTYCPADTLKKQHIRQVVVSLAGRARLAVDTNQNGIVDNGRGEDISC